MEINIVTGGSSGLGFEIAKELVRNGENVLIVGRNIEKLESAMEMLGNPENTVIESFAADISDEEGVKELFDSILYEGNTVKRLYNVAGEGKRSTPDEITKEMILDNFGANLIGLMLMSGRAFKEMRAAGKGMIVNIMSTAALTGKAEEPVYNAAKWGARGFTESLKDAAKNLNIKIVSVYPGGMKTPFWNEKVGMLPNTDEFMEPKDVAEEIVATTIKETTGYVSEITIRRK